MIWLVTIYDFVIKNETEIRKKIRREVYATSKQIRSLYITFLIFHTDIKIVSKRLIHSAMKMTNRISKNENQ